LRALAHGILFLFLLMFVPSRASGFMTCSDGSLEHYKARLVAHGSRQEHKCDSDETFAPMAHMTTVEVFLLWPLLVHGSSLNLM
jgi:hypothetical protein